MKRCEVCDALVAETWPVAINGDTDDIRNLCNGCAAMEPESAAVLDMLERDEA